MRTPILAILLVLGLAACGEAEPPKPAALAPVKPLSRPEAAAPPVTAPAPSADALLRERVRHALRDARDVDGQGIDVAVSGGEVSLFGTAPSAEERRRIEQFVAGLEGVRAVVSRIVIVRGS